MKNIFRLLFAVILFNGVISCRSTKKLQTAINKKDTTIIHTMPSLKDSLKVAHAALDNLQHNRIDFKTFSAQIKVQYEDASKKYPDLIAVIRIYKDSLIWVSISGKFAFINVEAYRALITPDHISILAKIDKQFEEHPFNYIEDFAKIPLDFKTLQDLIIGNPIFVGDKIVSYKETENHILISTVGKFFKNLLTISSANNNVVERSKLDDLDVTLNRTGDLTYGDYENKVGFSFSTYREITVAEKTKVDITLNFKQYDFNIQLSTPYSIPKNFKRK